jgi:hypothetical protein
MPAALRRIVLEKFPYGSFKYVDGDVNTVKEFFMNRKLIFALIMVGLLVIVAVFAFGQSNQNVRWEYIGVRHSSSDSSPVNAFLERASELGKEGWELTGHGAGVWVFKRRMP